MKKQKNPGHEQNSPHILGTVKPLEVGLKDVFGISPRGSRADWLPAKAGQNKYAHITFFVPFVPLHSQGKKVRR